MWSFQVGRAAGAILAFSVTVSACSWGPKIPTEYRIDVQQGNVVTQEMASQLRVGLTKDQVRFALGTPLLTDIFHDDRWDYLYRLEKGSSGEVEQRRLTVFFDKDGKLARVAGDVVAATASGPGQLQPEAKSRVIDLGSLPPGAQPAAPEEKGFFRRMLEKIGL